MLEGQNGETVGEGSVVKSVKENYCTSAGNKWTRYQLGAIFVKSLPLDLFLFSAFGYEAGMGQAVEW